MVSHRTHLRVATTHLEAGSTLQRAAQVERIWLLGEELSSEIGQPPLAKDELYASAPTPIGAVLCGDFNLTPHDAVYRLLDGVNDFKTELTCRRLARAAPRFPARSNLRNP